MERLNYKRVTLYSGQVYSYLIMEKESERDTNEKIKQMNFMPVFTALFLFLRFRPREIYAIFLRRFNEIISKGGLRNNSPGDV